MQRLKKGVLLLGMGISVSLISVIQVHAQENAVLQRYLLQPITQEVHSKEKFLKLWGEASRKAGTALLTGISFGEDDIERPPEEAKEESLKAVAAETAVKPEEKQTQKKAAVKQKDKKEKKPENKKEETFKPGEYPVMGTSSVTVEQMAAYYNTSGAKYPSKALSKGGAKDIKTFCRIFYEEAKAEGVRPEVAYVQAMKETGWLQYGGDSEITQFNFSGLGTTGGGVKGNSFPDVRTGIRAQIQHLKAYATDDALKQKCVDGRYNYVKKGCAPYVEWLGQQENPKGYGWATGKNYGYDIVNMIQELKKIS